MHLSSLFFCAVLALASASCADSGAHATVAEVSIPEAPSATATPRESSVPMAPSVPATEIVWSTSDLQDLAEAVQQRRPRLVYFSAEWCGACQELRNRTYKDKAVIAAMGRFVATRIDATDEDDPSVKEALRRHGVVALPSIVLYDSHGSERGRVNEFIDAEHLVTMLSGIR